MGMFQGQFGDNLNDGTEDLLDVISIDGGRQEELDGSVRFADFLEGRVGLLLVLVSIVSTHRFGRPAARVVGHVRLPERDLQQFLA